MVAYLLEMKQIDIASRLTWKEPDIRWPTSKDFVAAMSTNQMEENGDSQGGTHS